MKKLISFILSITLLLSVVAVTLGAVLLPSVFAAEFTGLTVAPFEDESTKINWWKSDATGLYYLFLPAGTDLTKIRVYTGGDDIEINGVTLHDGDLTDVFSKGTRFTMKHSYYGFSLVVKTSQNVPSVHISTESGSLDYLHQSKDNKEKGAVTVVENGEVTMSGVQLKQIKGRGNSTWGYPKKPYNIKFDKKTSLFGMEKAKKWSLLASYLDPSYLRNPLAFHLSEEMGLHFTPEYQFVDLYVNGDYLGSYLMTESVEVGDGRVDINDLAGDNEDANPDVEDLEDLPQKGTGAGGAVQNGFAFGSQKWIDIPNDPEDISGGYLLETDYRDRYAEELSGFVSNKGQCMVIKAPECASEAEVKYISAFFNEAEEALYAEDGYNSLGKHYTDYFDIDSLARMYILEEYSGDDDAGFSSCYFYKEKGSDKLVASPAWDFDLSFSNPSKFRDAAYNSGEADVWVAMGLQYSDVYNRQATTVPTVFNLAFRHADFRKAVGEVWTQYADLFSWESFSAFIQEKSDEVRESVTSDILRWRSKIVNPAKSFRLLGEALADFTADRTSALDLGFSDDAALLYYDVNGGSGYTFQPKIVAVGATVKVNDAAMGPRIRVYGPTETPVLQGWTLSPDGEGTVYKPGDAITLTSPLTTLYAKWGEPEALYGDIDNSGTITAADARLALRAAVDLEEFSKARGSAEFIRADVDLDDRITAADARLILRKAVGYDDLDFRAGRKTEPTPPEEPTTGTPEEPTTGTPEEPTTEPTTASTTEPTTEPTTVAPELPTETSTEQTTAPTEPSTGEPATGDPVPESTTAPTEPSTGDIITDPTELTDPSIPVDPPTPPAEPFWVRWFK